LGVDFLSVVVGGGVVGLAIAEACARQGADVLLIERHARLGQETTARNSEVVHAGLYYPSQSLKARYCVEGRSLLAAFCAQAGIPYARLGKLVVACTAAEIPALEALVGRARANGVDDVRMLSAAEALALEPALSCSAALHSPSTAVVDGMGVMLALEARFIDNGGTVASGTSVVAIERNECGFRVVAVSQGCEAAITCERLVLAGGLSATQLAGLISPPLRAPIPQTYFAKGHYYTMHEPAPFERLVYPMPVAGGLGIHYTLSTSGDVKFGPDVSWCETPNLTFDDETGDRRHLFVSAIRRYWPAVTETALLPAYAGVRPKLSRDPSITTDFAIQGPDIHGCTGLVALYGIESPGLTASLAIGRAVAASLDRVTA
jgi:L-2-hydroxyglutarate oxidase LhgO